MLFMKRSCNLLQNFGAAAHGTNVCMSSESRVHVVQDELARVLYPMFIHCYLELISKRATSEAHRLLTKQKQRFTSSGAQTAKIREQVCEGRKQLLLA